MKGLLQGYMIHQPLLLATGPGCTGHPSEGGWSCLEVMGTEPVCFRLSGNVTDRGCSMLLGWPMTLSEGREILPLTSPAEITAGRCTLNCSRHSSRMKMGLSSWSQTNLSQVTQSLGPGARVQRVGSPGFGFWHPREFQGSLSTDRCRPPPNTHKVTQRIKRKWYIKTCH